MEPVRHSIQAPDRRKKVLLAAVAAILLLLGGILWFGQSRELARTPITAAELDHQLMESGREEFLPLPAPTPADGKLREAQMALANRLPEEALKLANELLMDDTNNAAAYIVRGRAYSRKGDHVKAAESYAKAMSSSRICLSHTFTGDIYIKLPNALTRHLNNITKHWSAIRRWWLRIIIG